METVRYRNMQRHDGRLLKDTSLHDGRLLKDTSLHDGRLLKDTSLHDGRLLKDTSLHDGRLLKDTSLHDGRLLKDTSLHDGCLLKDTSLHDGRLLKDTSLHDGCLLKDTSLHDDWNTPTCHLQLQLSADDRTDVVAQDALVQSLVCVLFTSHDPFKIQRSVPEYVAPLVVDECPIFTPRDVYAPVWVLRRTVQHERRVLDNNYVLRLIGKVQPRVEGVGPWKSTETMIWDVQQTWG